MEVSFTIRGRAIPKERPRVTRQGYAYTPRTTQQFEEWVRTEYRLQCGDFRFPEAAPLVMEVEFYFTPPKSWSKAKQERAIARKKYPTTRPDLDNLWKGVADALNGIAYKDDSQIVAVTCRKMYGAKFCSKVRIRTLMY